MIKRILAFFSTKKSVDKICASLESSIDKALLRIEELKKLNNSILLEKEFVENELESTKKSLDDVQKQLSESEARYDIAKLQNKALVFAHTELVSLIKASIAVQSGREIEASRPPEELA